MIYSRKIIEQYGNQTGFIKNNIEKVIRLLDVLDFIFSKSSFKNCLVLKGGTAINLIHTNLKRLSVDIDLDYHGSLDRETAFKDREAISKELDDYMVSENYIVSPKSRGSVALLSKMYGYTTASGNLDYIKVEINYMDRISLYPTTLSTIRYFNHSLTIMTPSIEELFGMKIAALIDRSKPRDLYDAMFLVDNIKLFDIGMLKKSAIFYLSLDGLYELDNSSFDRIRAITQKDVKTELIPVLKKSDRFDLESSKREVMDLLNKLLSLDNEEKQYLKEFSNGKYNPNLLFDTQVANRAINHPMAKWKVLNAKK